jgi:hypothetical protein
MANKAVIKHLQKLLKQLTYISVVGIKILSLKGPTFRYFVREARFDRKRNQVNNKLSNLRALLETHLFSNSV